MSRDPLGLDRPLRERMDRLGQEFLARILGTETTRHPDNVEALADLGHVLTQLGRVEEGLAADRRLVELQPGNATAHYNLACSLALLERADEAIESLEAAIGLGYDDLDHLLADEDLASLRDKPRFQELAGRLERHG